jgi:dihydroxy-acid dehydratase
VLDVPEGRLDLDVGVDELERRRAHLVSPTPKYLRGYGALYVDHVLQADLGCDFDFLRAREDEASRREPYGLLSGWVGGW